MNAFFFFYILILSLEPSLCHKAFKQPLNNLLNISNLLSFIIQIIILSTVKHTDGGSFVKCKRYQVARTDTIFAVSTALDDYSKCGKWVLRAKLFPLAHIPRSKNGDPLWLLFCEKKVGEICLSLQEIMEHIQVFLKIFFLEGGCEVPCNKMWIRVNLRSPLWSTAKVSLSPKKLSLHPFRTWIYSKTSHIHNKSQAEAVPGV